MNSNSYEYDISCVCILQYDQLGKPYRIQSFYLDFWISSF